MTGLVIVAGLMWGLACAFAGLVVLSARAEPPDERRRELLRRGPSVLRAARPDRMGVAKHPRAAIAVQTDLRLAGDPLPWPGELYEARNRVLGGLIGMCSALLGLIMFGAAGLVGGAIGLVYPWLKRRELRTRVVQRVAVIRERLPFAIDLIAAQLTAGASSAAAVDATARELSGHPLGDELSALARAVDGGRSLAAAAREAGVFQADPDLAVIAAELIRAEEQGVPAATVFRGIARHLRVRAIAWAESAAQEAKVKMALPVMLIALACLLSLAAPFVLDALTR